MQPLKKKKKKKNSITESQQPWAICFTYLYTFVWNCAFVRVWPKTHTQKERTDEEDLWTTTKRKEKKERKKSNKIFFLKEREVK